MDDAFSFDANGLARAIALLAQRDEPDATPSNLPETLPLAGAGARETLEQLAPYVLGAREPLDAPMALAHMDPPTPWITWATTLWNASTNQNLLHPTTAPVARDIEARVIDWIAPLFGMNGGHMTPGSTVSNITALWAARENASIRRVVASEAAHLSVRKAAHILGLEFVVLPALRDGSLDANAVGDDLGDACLVLTAGTTSTGAIDDLMLETNAAWLHVDAAWAGPLRLCDRFAGRLDGIEQADSVAVSAHKWLFQPKESALVLFRDTNNAHAAISFGGAYLAQPNVGLLGSHGANAVPLMATLLAYGQEGVGGWIEHSMDASLQLAKAIEANPALELFDEPVTGVVVWRARKPLRRDAVAARLPQGFASTTSIDGEPWLRNVAANPNAKINQLVELVGWLE